jgi:hypothetical protein
VSPLWLYIIVASVAILLVAGIVAASVVLWRRQVRRSLIGLIGRRESVMAAYRALESVFTSLAAAEVDELEAFATDATSSHRRALEELHARMRIQSEELADLALPKRLWKAADLLGTAAGVLAVETGRVGEAASPGAVLEALGLVDVSGIGEALHPANEEIDAQLAARDIGDPAVYGGGLYI